jgi:hypothetical protein
MKNGEERFFLKENENIHVIGEELIVIIDGEQIQFDLVACPHCEGIFSVESYYPDNISSVVYCPYCQLEVGVEDRRTFLNYDSNGKYVE